MDRARAVRFAEQFGMASAVVGVTAAVGKIVVEKETAAFKAAASSTTTPTPTGFQFDPLALGLGAVGTVAICATAILASSPVVRGGETGKDGGEKT